MILCLPSAKPYGDLEVDNVSVYTPIESPKKEDMVYTPMGSSPTISVMV